MAPPYCARRRGRPDRNTSGAATAPSAEFKYSDESEIAALAPASRDGPAYCARRRGRHEPSRERAATAHHRRIEYGDELEIVTLAPVMMKMAPRSARRRAVTNRNAPWPRIRT